MNVLKPADVDAAERQVRIDLAACYRLVAHFGMDDLVYTHITARVPGTRDQFLINPFGTMFGEVTASSLVKIDLAGNVISPRGANINPAGFVVHSAIHMHRHDAGCILHTHTQAGMAVAAMKEGLLPLNQKSMMFYNRVGYHDYEGLAFSTDERERLYRDLGNHKALILRHHGLLVVGDDCADGFSLMYSLEVACRLQVAALSLNRPIELPDPKVSEHTAQQFESYPDPARTREWPGLLRMLDRLDPSYAQ
ncbi:MAG TPA: class II aldolase/adducin family protein [Alphaproteobacteria bacterium]